MMTGSPVTCGTRAVSRAVPAAVRRLRARRAPASRCCARRFQGRAPRGGGSRADLGVVLEQLPKLIVCPDVAHEWPRCCQARARQHEQRRPRRRRHRRHRAELYNTVAVDVGTTHDSQ